MNKWLLILSVLMGISAQAGTLRIDVLPTRTYALPVSMASCSQLRAGDIKKPAVVPNSFELSTLKLDWEGAGPMQIGFVQVDLKGETLKGGQYQCVIAADELKGMMYPNTEVISANKTVYSGMCGIRCGGVEFIKGVRSAEVQGTVKVVAYELNEEGRFVPVTAEAPITIDYSNY